MNTGDLIIAWTIRLSMLLLCATVFLQLQRHLSPRVRFLQSGLWTASFLLSVLHVLAAFHFVHHWSHTAAYLATAEETRVKLGFAYGAGVYFNYLFLVVWGLDVVWTWRGSQTSHRTTPWWIQVGRWYLLFITFNGVVVFKTGWLRILGITMTVGLLAIGILQLGRSSKSDASAREPSPSSE